MKILLLILEDLLEVRIDQILVVLSWGLIRINLKNAITPEQFVKIIFTNSEHLTLSTLFVLTCLRLSNSLG